MSDYHFGIDYDMWLYPQVHWWDSDCDDDLPEHIEAANIEGTLLVNADDAIEQVRKLQAENAELRQQLADVTESMGRVEERCAKLRELVRELYEDQCASGDEWKYRDRMRELGVEVGG